MPEKIKSLPRPLRMLLAIVFVVIAGGAYWLSAPGVRIYKANLKELKSTRSLWEVGGKEERVLFSSFRFAL